MGLYDRDYTKHNYTPPRNPNYGGSPITPAVKALLIINCVVYVLNELSGRQLSSMFALVNGGGYIWQVWRLIGYQFLHANMMHIMLNMLGLYFLGNTLERFWGSRKFIIFYLSCGVVGGLFFFLFTLLGFVNYPAILVGASGAVLGLLAACAILFPHFVVFFLIFPVPIRKAAVILPVIYLMTILTGGPNSGGEAAHLGGLLAGAAYLLYPKYKSRIGFSSHKAVDFTTPFAHTRSDNQRVDSIEVDRILKKVSDKGLHSLTEVEKQTLRRATEQHQNNNM